MRKLSKFIGRLFDKFQAWSWQRQANKIFDKSVVKYKDGDNT